MNGECKGRLPVTAKIDEETREALDRDADRMGEFRADVIRRALTTYLALRRGEFSCPSCGEPIQIEP